MSFFDIGRVLVMKSKPSIFGQHIDREIGAPQDYLLNKKNDTFAKSYDLYLPGAARSIITTEAEVLAN